MRYMFALLLVAAPLFAQESEAERARKDAEARARALETERAAQEKRRADRDDEIRKLLEELRSRSAETREQAIEALKRLRADVDDLLPLMADVLQAAERVRAALPVEVDGSTLYLGLHDGTAEVISGSSDNTDYTLKSLGEGKYELNASRRDAEGKLMEEFKDQGTMKELQEKYAFLKAALAIRLRVPPARSPVTVWRGRFDGATTTVQEAHWSDLGLWGGGGRVGVSVCQPSEDLRFHLQLPEGAGFIVQQVVPGSRAEQIGIRRMDILLKLDGELIDSPIQLKRLHEKAGVLELIRRSETKKIDLATIPEEKPVPPEKVEETPEGEGK